MMAANMAMALKASQQDVVGVFVSVDTERDSPAITQAYASSFHPSMMDLSGSFEQISQAANNFNISFVVTKSQKAYTVEHSSDIFLIAPDGKLLEVFAMNASPTDMAKAMKPPTCLTGRWHVFPCDRHVLAVNQLFLRQSSSSIGSRQPLLWAWLIVRSSYHR